MYQIVRIIMAIMMRMETVIVGTTTKGMEILQSDPDHPPSQLEQVPVPLCPVG